MVHGGVDTVNFLCDAPSVRAISFVGGNMAGEHIFDRGTKNGKRVQVFVFALTIVLQIDYSLLHFICIKICFTSFHSYSACRLTWVLRTTPL